MSTIHQQLKASLQEYHQFKKVLKYSESLRIRLDSEKSALRRLEKKLEKEERDVLLLEKTSVRSLFHKVLGDKELQLEKERQEYLQVALQFNALNESVKLVEYELSILEKKLLRLPELETQLNRLKHLREEEIRNSDPVFGRELKAIGKRLDESHKNVTDIEDALNTGKLALDKLEKMERYLREARNWGSWDMVGGGRGYWKHMRIDKARALSNKVKHALLRFREDLKAIGKDHQIDMRIDIGSFDRFTDIFFDNLIADWVVQQKIKNALKNVVYLQQQIRHALAQIEEEIPILMEAIEELELRREEIILEA